MPLADADKKAFELLVHGTIAAAGGQEQKTVTPLHYIRTTFPGLYDPAGLLTAFGTACQAAWVAFCSSRWTIDKFSVRCLNSPTEAYVDLAVGVAGSVATDMSPAFVTGKIRKKTALRGPSYRGRLGVSGVPEAGTTGDALTAPYKTLLDALATALGTTLVDGNGNNYVPAVLSRHEEKTDLTADPAIITITQITSFEADSVVGSQNSRKSHA